MEPERHIHLAEQEGRRGELLQRLLGETRASVERAESEPALGGEGPHLQLFAQRDALTVRGFGLFEIGSAGVRGDLPEQVVRMGELSLLAVSAGQGKALLSERGGVGQASDRK